MPSINIFNKIPSALVSVCNKLEESHSAGQARIMASGFFRYGFLVAVHQAIKPLVYIWAVHLWKFSPLAFEIAIK
jgi:hypothetical protein